jgi:D-beta-D-heptose 7-phosphate kinase/D-beta-D-heptose 1-phosphate adenosyltransferase
MRPARRRAQQRCFDGAAQGAEAPDPIVIFEEDTPIELIRDIRPQILVKGDDYRLDEVVGADFVKSSGGEVFLARVVPGYSTTATIARLAS